ncbi:MAG: GxxExxY protein [Patescibacteria group bacterium]|nr:GxxExxY protein [Patescibacteria group bacterium]MDE2014962.1 GxxExxY protein [Patescibacteria group bacterium]MDE2226391.1 GxxExxY protein [Patescibacteria group bacterium]
MENIRNFVIIAHIDSGKSTLADRLLEITGTVDARRMKPQYLDKLELERERGITIKMAPVRMLYKHPAQINADDTQINADTKFLYKELTYKIRGAAFDVWNKIGPGFRESVYQKSLEIELKSRGVDFIAQPHLKIQYDDKPVGDYYPDLLINKEVLIELKALPFIGDTEKKQAWSYLRGSDYKISLLINFAPKGVEIERIVYDSARDRRTSASDLRKSEQVEYILNLIDTPGHSDFSYEVSRALTAVEGAVLLIDGAKGIQAQTLSNLRAARKAGLTIIGAVNKIDLDLPHINKVIKATADLLGVGEEEIFRISAKTGEGVKELLGGVVKQTPPPKKIDDTGGQEPRALIFDSLYDDHKGILAFVRVFPGVSDNSINSGSEVVLLATGAKFKIKEVGYFSPELKATPAIGPDEMGYVATGLKEPALVHIGDTIAIAGSKAEQLHGYKEPAPVVFIAFYPDGDTKFEDLQRGLERLRLTDAALSFEPDANEALGRGLKVGFLGQLHFEITASRLEREFNLEFLTSFPSIAYRVRDGGKDFIVKEPHEFPMKPERVWQPMIKMEILAPQAYLSQVVNLKTIFDIEVSEIKNIGDNLLIIARMPLSELIRDFDDKLKSVSAGFASFSYELDGEAEAEVEKLEILVAEEVVPALTRIVAKKDMEREARTSVERLKELLPKQQFSQAVQARAMGRIVARETIAAMKKALGDFGKNGGDRTRKMKLWKKQQRGKKRLKETGRVSLSPEVFREILKK